MEKPLRCSGISSSFCFLKAIRGLHRLVNGYASPEQLGADRWLAMKAAWAQSVGKCCVISCGTAITVDRVDAAGQHLGGLIFPGLQMMRNALASETEKLPHVAHDHILSDAFLANNTVDAIVQGTLLGVTAFVEMQLNKTQAVFLTGGDAERVAQYLSSDITIDPHLVLKGLSINQ